MHQEATGQGASADRCVVVLWRGYVTGQFLARRSGSVEPFLASRTFRTWRPPWQPRAVLEELPEASAAFHELTVELLRHGWRCADGSEAFDGCVFARSAAEHATMRDLRPASISEPFLLRALDEVAGESGATAAEVGRALYGDDAPAVRRLPQRIGTRLRRLQLQGKVDRRETNGVNRWFPASPSGNDRAAAR